MTRNLCCLAISSIVTAFAGTAHANLISNGGFEFGNDLGTSGWSVYQQLDDNDTDTNDWTTVVDSNGIIGAGIEVQAGTTGGIGPHSGTYKVELDSHNGVNGSPSAPTSTNTIMAQTVSGLTFGEDYELSFWYTARPGTSIATNGIDVYAGTPDLFSSPGLLGSVSSNDVLWTEYSYRFTATATTMSVGFGAGGTANTLGGYLDDVSLSVSVPEPGSAALLALSLIGLATTSRRKTA